MKVTAIPAQITTVEDRIAGNISMTQLLLLSTPLFISAAIYFGLPPFTHFSVYKIVLAALVAGIMSSLAIRIKSRLVIDLLKLRISYNLRPRVYVHNRRELSPNEIIPKDQATETNQEVKAKVFKAAELDISKLIQGQGLLYSPEHQVTFKIDKKGGLNVRVAEA